MKPAMLALVTDAFGGHGGIAQYNRDLFRALAEGRGLASLTVVPRHAPGDPATPAGVIQLPARAGRAAYALKVLQLAVSRRFQLVFCGHLYMAPFARIIARILGAKLIVQMHGIEAWQPPSQKRRAAVEGAALVLCVSRHTRAQVLSWAAIAPERIVVLPNMVGEAFTPGADAGLRAQWGLQGKIVLLTVGRMDARERYKGHDRVIQAIPVLVAEGRDIAYVVLGEGDDRPRLEACAREAGVADRVHFKGAVDRATLMAAYRMADLFVMPSTGEGFGIVFLEAMACGTPALGLGVAGASDALVDGELGHIVSEKANLPAAILHRLAQPKPDPKVLSAAVRARFGPAAFAANIRDAFQQVLEQQAASVLSTVTASRRFSI